MAVCTGTESRPEALIEHVGKGQVSPGSTVKAVGQEGVELAAPLLDLI